MQQQHPPQAHRGTPGRRRGNRHFANSPARKTYASESDMPTDVPYPMSFGRQSPFTPQKAGANSPAPGSQQHPNSKSKSRSGNKSRSKQIPTSPGPSKPGRTTPPQTAASKTAAATAFAGATFHASPAPSSLPIPSFLAKALDSPGLKDTDRGSQEPSPPATDSEAPTPQPRSFLADITRESPLDIFFRADRAEKERARRASSANILVTNPGPFSPPLKPTSPQEPRTLPSGLGTSRRRPTTQRIPSTAGISSIELDGTPGRPMGPAFSTPYQDRIRAAARSSEKSTESLQRTAPQPQQPQPATDDLSERLKKFLAVPMDASPMQPNSVPTSQGWSASTAQQSTVPPRASIAVEGGRPTDLLHMEDSLRRLLKIDPGSNLGGAPPTSYQSS